MAFPVANGPVTNVIVKGLLGLFYAITLAVFTWVGSSLYQITLRLPVIEERLSTITAQITGFNEFRQQGEKFTAQDGVTLAQFVQQLQVRLTVAESNIEDLQDNERREYGEYHSSKDKRN